MKSLVDQFLEEAWKANPVKATSLGIHKYDSELGSFNKEAVYDRLSSLKGYGRRLKTQIEQADLAADEILDYRLLKNGIDEEILNLEVIRDWERNPGFYLDLALDGLFYLLVRESVSLQERAENIISRLEKIPELLSNGQKNLVNPPRVFTQTAIDVTKAGLKFISTAIPSLTKRTKGLGAPLLTSREKALVAFEKYLNFLENELYPKASGRFAIGREAFIYRLKYGQMLDYTPEELSDLAQFYLAETEEKLNELAKKIDPYKSWQEIFLEMKGEHPEREEVIPFYRVTVNRARRFVIDENLVSIPQNECLKIVPTPIYLRPTHPYAAYEPPAPYEADQTGFLYVSPVDENLPPEEQEAKLSWPGVYGVDSVVAHETYPGHHLQLTLANSISSKVRKHFTTSQFKEGWALYCEEMMGEQGFYSRKAHIFQLWAQSVRTLRVLLDVGLHCFEMGLSQAEETLRTKGVMERSAAVAEVKRYALKPTQPLSYLIGKLEILKLRKEYSRKVGRGFNPKDFHSRLLSFGSIPLRLIREGLIGKTERNIENI